MKNTKTSQNLLQRYSSELGVAIMTLATVVGMLELPDHSVNTRYILPGQPIKVTVNDMNDMTNPIRRDKEDTNQEYVSYSESQRTPSRSGKY
jgi:hypothetical protein